MRLGYNTNGLAHHRLTDAIEILSELGYESVAITLDHSSLNPFAPNLPSEIELIAAQLSRLGMASVIETGARFLLDPHIKHEPTLMSASQSARAQRIDFLCRAIDIAARLGSDCVSFWSGIVHDDIPVEAGFERLVPGIEETISYADQRDVVLGFEPEPGMFVDTMSRHEDLLGRIDARLSSSLQLTLDIGHLHCMDEVPMVDVIRKWHDRIVNVHLEDIKRGLHEHLMFGEGEIAFPPVLEAFREFGYRGGLHVELSRHSHDGVNAARQARDFLVPMMGWSGPSD